MCKIKIYSKLVRDKTPEIISKNGAKPEVEILNDGEYLKYLDKKLLEECNEVLESKDKKSRSEELADVLEVIFSIASVFEITPKEIEKIRLDKKEKCGGFQSKNFLKNVINN